MDIDLLSKMISELIVDHDRVGLPGVGTFYTEVVPSTFSDRGYTINPPYRRLSFLPNAVENDLLVNFYSDVNGTPADMAREYIVQFLRELAEALKEHKTITLPGLGRLRATKENNFFFVADEDLDIYPEAFGLAPVSLKNIPGLDDDKVDIRFEFKPPVRKAAEPEPAYAASETSEPSAPAAEPVSGAGTSAAAETAAMQEPASESAEGAEVSSGADATAEPAALSASAATAAVAEPAKVAAPAETVAPIVPAGPAASAERTETAEPAESAKPAELIEPAEPAVAAAPEASVQEPNAAVPETSEPSAPAAEPVSGDGTSAAAETAATQESASESAEGAEVSSGADATAEPAEPGALANCAEETRVVEEDDGQTEKKLPSAERIPAPAAEEDDGRTVKKFRWWIPLLVLSALAAIFLAVFLILAHVAPDFIDSILYTPEELRIINY